MRINPGGGRRRSGPYILEKRRGSNLISNFLALERERIFAFHLLLRARILSENSIL